MQALSGNSNDTKAFAQTVRRHLSSLKGRAGSAVIWSAMPHCTNADTLQLLAQQQQLFVTRVPSLSMRQSRPWQAIGAQPRPLWAMAIAWPLATRELCQGRAALVCWCAANKPATASGRRGKTCSKDGTRELKAFAKLCARRFCL